MPFLHGAQGCSTYIRRYLISHFNEPIDVASSSFSESSTVFGGGDNLKEGLRNVTRKYHPRLIGVATTCLAETIGDDVQLLLQQYRQGEELENPPLLVHVSTPSYTGTHVDGFHLAVLALVKELAHSGSRQQHVNLLPGMVSPADLRYLKEVVADFDLPMVMLPDYSETLDAPLAQECEGIPEGGTPISAIRSMGEAKATLEFGRTHITTNTAGKYLQEEFGIGWHPLGMPIGLRETDHLFQTLEKISGKSTPHKYQQERGRLLDAMVDGHKNLSGVKAVVYGEEDFVIGLVSFLTEIGIDPVVCASGGESGHFAAGLHTVARERVANSQIVEGADFDAIEDMARETGAELVIGHSKGYTLAKRLGIPLIRLGFPIHDRLGGQRILHLGYRGALALYDLIVNTVIARKQDKSSVGYSYM